MPRRSYLMSVVALLLATITRCAETPTWRPETRWRGFNLLELFSYRGQPAAFREHDFRLISELGFNFVRLPLDYRFWICDGNWEAFDDSKLAPIDQAIAWGKKYGIHVQLCFHRAPGYTVAQPSEPHNLFSDEHALRVCCHHWSRFARRYQGIPSHAVSFNLFNEPGEVEEAAYAKVAGALVAAIRTEDPDRFIVADGIAWGGRPAQSLFKLGIGQAMRGYKPMSISHYLASWVGTPSAEPIWPPPQAVSPLYGPIKAPLNVPLVMERVPAGTLTLRLGMVSGRVCLRVTADEAVVLKCDLDPKPGTAGWTNVVYKSEWKISQGRCLSVLSVDLPKGAQRLSVSIPQGDWAQLSQVTLTGKSGQAESLWFEQTWGKTNRVFRFMGFGACPAFQSGAEACDGLTYLRQNVINPWQPAFDAGIFTMVGEFGAFKHTPHPLVLKWMEDNLKLWKEAGLGWALWNFRGTFGILDSERADVRYEEFHGHKLDRRMLDLLQKY